MSIQIDKSVCVGCAKCVEACPGNLIHRDENNRAEIKRVRDCWGCTSCLKECKVGAISFFLGADIGGRGSVLSVREEGDLKHWTVTDPDGNRQTITINSKESNKY
ncbi:MAG: ferredoxin family protein [Lachnospiraceae bacterium]|nr:ferredoxin family protein [Lachnospiraceae bacterium]